MTAKLLYEYKWKSVKFGYSFSQISGNLGMSFSFCMHVGFADILRLKDNSKQFANQTRYDCLIKDFSLDQSET